MKDAEHTHSLAKETEIKTTMRYHFIPATTGMVTFRKWQVTSIGEPLEILVPLNTAGGNGKWLIHCRKMVPPTVIRTTICSCNFTSKYTQTHTPKRNGNKYSTAERKKKTAKRYETTQMSINGWMDKQTVVHTHNRRLFSHKKNKVLMKATTWMNPENTVLSEGSQTCTTAAWVTWWRWKADW